MDMVSRAYQSGSYGSVFEVHAFIERCSKYVLPIVFFLVVEAHCSSAQLLLSKCELALLQLVVNIKSIPDCRDYIEVVP